MQIALLGLGIFLLIANSIFIETNDNQAIGNCTDINCLSCISSPDDCDACMPLYYYLESDGRCQTCTDIIYQCQTCTQLTVHDPVSCTQCAVLTFYVNNSCLYCNTAIPNCIFCSQASMDSPIICLQCANSFCWNANACIICDELRKDQLLNQEVFPNP